MLSKNRVTQTYAGLKYQQSVLVQLLQDSRVLKPSRARSEAEMLEEEALHNKNIERIRQVLVLVEKGLTYFETNWINEKGDVRKFSWFNPFSWKLMGQSIQYYAGLFDEIAQVYEDNK